VLEQLGVDYILLGKVQTDNLERRFGEYRQLSGGNYHVSVQQVLEAEKKLRISSVLSLKSDKLGHVVIEDLCNALAADEDSEPASSMIPTEFKQVASEAHELCINLSCDEASLVYVAGFVAHKCGRVVCCETCKTLVNTDRDLELTDDSIQIDYSYVQSLDRGGLKYPTLMVILLGHKVLSVLQVLVSKKYESKFLQLQTQKAVTHSIVLQLLTQDDFFLSEASGNCCACGRQIMDLIKLMIPRYLNVFINNYTKKYNDEFRAAGGKNRKKRKLQTLTG